MRKDVNTIYTFAHFHTLEKRPLMGAVMSERGVCAFLMRNGVK